MQIVLHSKRPDRDVSSRSAHVRNRPHLHKCSVKVRGRRGDVKRAGLSTGNGADRFGYNIIDVVQLTGLDDVGRQDVDDVAEWAKENTLA